MSIVNILDYKFNIDSSTLLGNLTEVWEQANKRRELLGKKSEDLEEWLQSDDTIKFLGVLESKITRDCNGIIYANFYIIMDALMYLDSDVKVTALLGYALTENLFSEYHMKHVLNDYNCDVEEYLKNTTSLVFGTYDASIDQWDNATPAQLDYRNRLFKATEYALTVKKATNTQEVINAIKQECGVLPNTL